MLKLLQLVKWSFLANAFIAVQCPYNLKNSINLEQCYIILQFRNYSLSERIKHFLLLSICLPDRFGQH